jgi:hypothetical protein
MIPDIFLSPLLLETLNLYSPLNVGNPLSNYKTTEKRILLSMKIHINYSPEAAYY